MLPPATLVITLPRPRHTAAAARSRRPGGLLCSASAAWLQTQGQAGQTGRWDDSGNNQGGWWELEFQLHHEYDSDIDDEPEEELLSPILPTATPLKRSFLIARDRLRQLSVGSRRLLAGGYSAAVSKTATAPLETLKMQLVQGRISVGQAARSILASHGPWGFFRGNAMDVLRTVPSKGLELAAYDTLKQAMRRVRGPNGEPKLPEAVIGGVAGGLAGILSTIATYPMETVRTRMAVAAGSGSAGATAHYSSVLDCVLTMASREGVGSLWKGLDASLVGVIPYAALRLGIYDFLKFSYKKATHKHHIDPQAALAFGAIAGIASSTATFPFEVARRRMMMGAPYPNMAAAITTILQQEGVAALFNGVWLSLVKQGPQYAIAFATYEMAKMWLDL